MTSPRFFIAALPRSRSAWLANLLTHQGAMCMHEALIGCASMGDLERKFVQCGAEVAGSAETGLALVVDDIVQAFPDARFVCVVRDPSGFTEQSLRLEETATVESIGMLLDEFRDTVEHLHSLGNQTMIVRPRQLDEYEVCQAIWEHIGMRTPLHRQRFEMLKDFKVEIFLDRMQARAKRHLPELKQLLGDA